ncbi:MAG TPA: hypothetical protein VFN23_21320 [Ktedonobacteraceae bacterium]|nr:hypothetical protein [Ktedonobacteraceae bacterium]
MYIHLKSVDAQATGLQEQAERPQAMGLKELAERPQATGLEELAESGRRQWDCKGRSPLPGVWGCAPGISPLSSRRRRTNSDE